MFAAGMRARRMEESDRSCAMRDWWFLRRGADRDIRTRLRESVTIRTASPRAIDRHEIGSGADQAQCITPGLPV